MSSGVQLQSPNITFNPSSNLSVLGNYASHVCHPSPAPTAHSVPSLPSLALDTTDKEMYLRHSLYNDL